MVRKQKKENPSNKDPYRETLETFYPSKSMLNREKTSKSTRENLSLPLNFSENLPVKNSSYPWKKPTKLQKGAFTGYFEFQWEKNTEG